MGHTEDRQDAEFLLDEQYQISFHELVMVSGLSPAEIQELVELGLFEPRGPDTANWVFSARTIITARTASRLRRDFELDANATALALAYIERIHELESRLRMLECRLPGEQREPPGSR